MVSCRFYWNDRWWKTLGWQHSNQKRCSTQIPAWKRQLFHCIFPWKSFQAFTICCKHGFLISFSLLISLLFIYLVGAIMWIICEIDEKKNQLRAALALKNKSKTYKAQIYAINVKAWVFLFSSSTHEIRLLVHMFIRSLTLFAPRK